MSDSEQRRVADLFFVDSRLRLATREAFVTVYPDGWAGPSLTVRVHATQRKPIGIVL
jgi:hypothetical protein